MGHVTTKPHVPQPLSRTQSLCAAIPESCATGVLATTDAHTPTAEVCSRRSAGSRKAAHHHEAAPARGNSRKPTCGKEDPVRPKVKKNQSFFKNTEK